MNLLQTIPAPEVSSITVGPFVVHFYALCILAGIIAAVLIADFRLKRRGVESGKALDIAMWTVPIAIIGARLFHVLTHPGDYFYEGADLVDVFKVWEGGIAIYGGLIGGAAGAWIGAKRAGVKFWSFADAVAPGILLAQAIGRWGNYFNQELFGTPTDLPWALEISGANSAIPQGIPLGTTYHPTFLYESIWSLIGVALLFALDRKYQLRWGKLFAIYVIYYSFGRIWTESIRIDPSEVVLGLRINVWSAILGIAVGLAIWFIQSRRHPGIETSAGLDSTNQKTLDERVYEVDSDSK
ncbi:MAG: hypothetical protein RLZZ258_465 [Actinomycetota bacterium]|jgi:prolipoprotein diacylglyceryl transferase